MKLFKKQQCNTTYSGIISAESEKFSAMAPLPPEDCQEKHHAPTLLMPTPEKIDIIGTS